jgi:hypothetical protein
MSRRCARECVAWPRAGAAVDVADALLGRLWPLTMWLGLWDDAADARRARGDEHDRVMDDLRERPVLP